MALFFECMLSCAQKLLDTADIVREAIYQQLSSQFIMGVFPIARNFAYRNPHRIAPRNLRGISALD
jgi:hypothetical protein